VAEKLDAQNTTTARLTVDSLIEIVSIGAILVSSRVDRMLGFAMKILPKSRASIIALAAVVVIAVAAAATLAFGPAAKRTAINVDSSNVAIHGYDTVAYFTEGRAVKGKAEFAHDWQGGRWHFANATHRDLFAANPERYAPRYGGYCTLGVALGEYSDVDPEQWTIVDDMLYLNKTAAIRDQFRKAPKHYTWLSNINWRKYRDKLRVNENLQ
jgi:YHS domain-containing protein